MDVKGNGFAEFDRALMPHRRRQQTETIKLTITTVEHNGLVFWQGDQPSDSSQFDYLAIKLVNGFAVFEYDLGSGAAVITSSLRVDDGYQHVIEIKRLSRDGSIIVDGQEVKGSSKGPLQVLNVQSNLYFGGVPDLEKITFGKATGNFIGCIRDIQIQDQSPLNIGSQALRGANAHPCLD